VAGESLFPAFTPILPPPLIGQGGGPAPTFPPPTPPPAGKVPVGVLVGPVVAPGGGPEYDTPTIGGDNPGEFPAFTTTFPVPPIVFVNQMMIGDMRPPQTPTTQNIFIGGWGLPPPPEVASSSLEESVAPEGDPPSTTRRRRRR